MGKASFSFVNFQSLIEPANFFLFEELLLKVEEIKVFQWNLKALLHRRGSEHIKTLTIILEPTENLVVLIINDSEALFFEDYFLFVGTKFQSVKRLGNIRMKFSLLINNNHNVGATISYRD
jgi:hypothetical protein